MSSDSTDGFVCSLSAEDQLQRLREFSELFETALVRSRREPRRLELTLDASATSEEQVRDLLRREHECCPFFEFEVRASTASELQVVAEVPEGAEPFLDGLEQITASARR
jgi:hypothetical protein